MKKVTFEAVRAAVPSFLTGTCPDDETVPHEARVLALLAARDGEPADAWYTCAVWGWVPAVGTVD
jgi:hypothetical protein